MEGEGIEVGRVGRRVRRVVYSAVRSRVVGGGGARASLAILLVVSVWGFGVLVLVLVSWCLGGWWLW